MNENVKFGCDHVQKNWNYIQSYDMSEFNPDNLLLDEYAFMTYFEEYETDDFETFEQVININEMRCMLASGCQCGDHTCSWGAECIKGECKYSKVYESNFCGINWYNNRRQETSISGEDLKVSCNGTTIIPSEPHLEKSVNSFDEWVSYVFKSEYKCADDG